MSTQNTTDNNRTLLVGAKSPACTSISWATIGQVNLVEYDRLILIARHLPEQILKHYGSEIGPMNEKINRVLASGGELIVVTKRPALFALKASPTQSNQHRYDIKSFLPFPVTFKNEAGTTVILDADCKYRDYLTKIRNWNFWFEGLSGTATIQYLTNREGRMLAGYLNLNGIDVTILPDQANLSADEIAHEILKELGVAVADETPPEWADAIPMPGLPVIDADIAASEAKIEKETVTLSEQKRKRRDLARFRALLYATGDELEAIAERVFAQFGVAMDDNRHSVEDLLGSFGDETCVFEVTGTDGPLKLSKVRQLFNHAFLVEEKTGVRPKAILVANPLRKIVPDKREESDTPEFPQNVNDRAVEMKIALVSGRWLFDKHCEFLDGKIAGPDVLDEILRTDGLVG